MQGHKRTSTPLHPSAAAATHTGRARPHNQDAWWAPGPRWPTPEQLAAQGYLYVVADGMGGHAAGDVASRTAVETIAHAYYQAPDPDPAAALERAVQTANDQIHLLAQEPAYRDMGATVVAAVVRGQELALAHAGDSRAYLLRDGLLQPLTRDHTWVTEKVAEGLLTPEEAANHPQRNVVTRSLGQQPLLQPEVQRYAFLPGDRLLLCTDGVWEMLAEAELARVLGGGRPGKAAGTLVKRIAALQGADDATALVVGGEPLRTGALAPLQVMVAEALASPQQRVVLGGISVVLIVAMLTWGVITLLPDGEKQDTQATTGISAVLLATTPRPTVAVSPTATASPTPKATVSPTVTVTFTLTKTPIPKEPKCGDLGECLWRGKLNVNKPLYSEKGREDSGHCEILKGTIVAVINGDPSRSWNDWVSVRIRQSDIQCGSSNVPSTCDGTRCEGYLPAPRVDPDN